MILTFFEHIGLNYFSTSVLAMNLFGFVNEYNMATINNYIEHKLIS